MAGDASHNTTMADLPSSSSAATRRHREGEALQQYYIAVDRQEYKMETLVELLTVLGRRASLPVAICCNSRDSLDAVCAKVSASQQFSLVLLHSDQGESERTAAQDNFHQVVADWTRSGFESSAPASGSSGSEEIQERKSGLLVTTDACLPAALLGEASLGARVLIHYDLPAKKEAYVRRLAACLASISTVSGGAGSGGASGGIVISVVVGGEVGMLRSIEEGCGVVIDEMPIHARFCLPELFLLIALKTVGQKSKINSPAPHWGSLILDEELVGLDVSLNVIK